MLCTFPLLLIFFKILQLVDAILQPSSQQIVDPGREAASRPSMVFLLSSQ